MGQGCDGSGTAVGCFARAVAVAEGDGGYGHRLRCCVIAVVVVVLSSKRQSHHAIVEGGGCRVVAEMVIVDSGGCVVNVNVNDIVVVVHSRRSAISGHPVSCYAGGGCCVKFKVVSVA
jgi:hypothetical protein